MTGDYETVKREAQRIADETGFDQGVEKYNGLYWRTWQLPAKANRFGFELRCEVVMCTDYRKQQPGHGFSQNLARGDVKGGPRSVSRAEDTKMTDTTTTRKPLKMKRPLSEARQAALIKAHDAVRARWAAKKAAATVNEVIATAPGALDRAIAAVAEPPGKTLVEVFAAEEKAKPVVHLVGQDGNAFILMGQCTKAARKAGWTQEKITEVLNEMKAGDYDHLLRTAMKHFDVR